MEQQYNVMPGKCFDWFAVAFVLDFSHIEKTSKIMLYADFKTFRQLHMLE